MQEAADIAGRKSQGPGQGADAQLSTRQQQVLDAVLELLADGADAVTMSAVAQRASCSKETLYKWFGDRDGLLTATVRWQASKVAAGTFDKAKLDANALVASLEAFAVTWLKVISSKTSIALNRVAVAHAASAKDNLGQIVLANGRLAIGERLKPLLEAAREAKLIDFDDSETAFRTFFETRSRRAPTDTSPQWRGGRIVPTQWTRHKDCCNPRPRVFEGSVVSAQQKFDTACDIDRISKNCAKKESYPLNLEKLLILRCTILCGECNSPRCLGGERPIELLGEESRQLGARIRCPHECLSDQKGVDTARTHPGDVSGRVDAAFRDHDLVGRHALQQIECRFQTGVEGPQIPVVDPEQTGLESKRPIEFGGVMDFHEHGQSEFPGGVLQFTHLRRLQRGDDQEHAVGFHLARLDDLVRIDDEVLSENRKSASASRRSQVFGRALEEPTVRQNRQTCGAVLLIASSDGRGIEVRTEQSLARARLLDFGDHGRPPLGELGAHRAFEIPGGRTRDRRALEALE
mgnify:CR=1 FL=1